MPDISIVIPTFDRPSKLQRSLEYYRDSGIPVFVADGSERPFEGSIAANVTYHHVPAVSYAERVLWVLGKVSTAHIALAADDDFLVPEFIRHADTLLSRRTDHSAVFGRCYSFQ